MTLNLQFSCFHLPSAGIISISHHALLTDFNFIIVLDSWTIKWMIQRAFIYLLQVHMVFHTNNSLNQRGLSWASEQHYNVTSIGSPVLSLCSHLFLHNLWVLRNAWCVYAHHLQNSFSSLCLWATCSPFCPSSPKIPGLLSSPFCSVF